MSIAEQLIKAKNNLANSRKAIVAKGGTVGEVAKFDNLASEILSIPLGGADYLLVEDTDTAYKKQILAGASPLAKIKSVGGMTYKDEETQTLRDTKVTELISNGANLLDISKCMNTVLSDNGDGTYNLTVRGTNRFSNWSPLNIPANTRIYFSGKLISGTIAVNVQFRLADGSYPTLGTINGDTWSYTYASSITGIRLYLQSAPSDGAYSVISELMLAYDRVSYTPYKGIIDTVAIPEAVQASKGINDTYYDYIEFKDGRVYYHKNVYECVYEKGTDNLKKAPIEGQTTTRFYLTDALFPELSVRKIINTISDGTKISLCDNLNFVLYEEDKEGYYLHVNSTILYIKSPYTTVEETADWLDGTKFIFALETPEVTDITHLFTDDNYIEVESGGTITAVNEHENAVPFNIAYIRRTT